MIPVRLKVVSNGEVVASITCDGSHGGHGSYFSVVSVKGFVENKRIYGIDPVQSFVLGWRLIGELTNDRRVQEENLNAQDGASWQIESF